MWLSDKTLHPFGWMKVSFLFSKCVIRLPVKPQQHFLSSQCFILSVLITLMTDKYVRVANYLNIQVWSTVNHQDAHKRREMALKSAFRSHRNGTTLNYSCHLHYLLWLVVDFFYYNTKRSKRQSQLPIWTLLNIIYFKLYRFSIHY